MKFFFTLPLLFIVLFLPSVASAAIARDNNTDGVWGNGSSATVSFTVGTGADRILFVSILKQSSQTVSSVTYGGIAMTQVESVTGYTSAENLYIYMLVNPPSGANNIVATYSGSGVNLIYAASYTGARQTDQPDAHTNQRVTSGTSLSTSLNTVANNSWMYGFFRVANGSQTADSNTSFFTGSNDVNQADTNGVQTPVGSHSMGTNSYGNGVAAQMIVSFAPALSTNPTNLEVESQTNPTNIATSNPRFSALVNSASSTAIASDYQLQISTNPSSFSSVFWDSGRLTLSSSTPAGQRTPQIFSTSTLPGDQTKYYWRIRFFDQYGGEGAWSTSTASFIHIFTPIARDNSINRIFGNSGTSFTYSYAVGTGTNRILFVSVLKQSSQTVSSVTYDGVAMTQVESVLGYTSAENLYTYMLINPHSGTHDIVATYSGSGVDLLYAASYTGAAQTAQPDEHANQRNTSASSLGTSLTTIADNSWMYGFFRTSVASQSAGSNTSFLDADNDVNQGDTNANQTPSGSHTMTTNSSASGVISHLLTSFAPAAAMNPPTDLEVESQTNPTNIATSNPRFSALVNSASSTAIAGNYEIQVSTSSTSWSSLYWDSGKLALSSSTPAGMRVPQIFSTTTFSFNGTKYYWRIRFWDQYNGEMTWSTRVSSFTMRDCTSSCTMTFYPDAGTGATTVDGAVNQEYTIGSGAIWANARTASGSGSYDSVDDTYVIGVFTDNGSLKYRNLYRSIFLFDTSAIGSGNTVTSATLSLYGNRKFDDSTTLSPDINIVSANPTSNTSLTSTDFSTFGSTPFSSAISYSSFNTSGYNDFALNSSGIAAINATGVSKFGAINDNYDRASSTPASWTSLTDHGLSVYFADKSGIDKDPKLVVTFTTP